MTEDNIHTMLLSKKRQAHGQFSSNQDLYLMLPPTSNRQSLFSEECIHCLVDVIYTFHFVKTKFTFKENITTALSQCRFQMATPSKSGNHLNDSTRA